jgi:hypothetical protein
MIHAGRSIIFRQHGDNPPSSFAAQGAFACGMPSDFLEPSSSERPEADLVFLFGGPNRYRGNNGRILRDYLDRGTPVLMVEFGTTPDRVLVHPNGNKRYLPTLIEGYGDRRQLLGYEPSFRARGSEILVAGQGETFDRQLEHAVWGLSQQGVRRVVFRRHPHDHGSYVPPGCDSESTGTLEEDLGNAFAVVTHSSGVGRAALLEGIPVLAHESSQFSNLSYRLHEAWRIEDIEPAGIEDVRSFFDRFAFLEWTHEELRVGLPINFHFRLL